MLENLNQSFQVNNHVIIWNLNVESIAIKRQRLLECFSKPRPYFKYEDESKLKVKDGGNVTLILKKIEFH